MTFFPKNLKSSDRINVESTLHNIICHLAFEKIKLALQGPEKIHSYWHKFVHKSANQLECLAKSAKRNSFLEKNVTSVDRFMQLEK